MQKRALSQHKKLTQWTQWEEEIDQSVVVFPNAHCINEYLITNPLINVDEVLVLRTKVDLRKVRTQDLIAARVVVVPVCVAAALAERYEQHVSYTPIREEQEGIETIDALMASDRALTMNDLAAIKTYSK